MKRRDFLKTTAVAGSASVLPATLSVRRQHVPFGSFKTTDGIERIVAVTGVLSGGVRVWRRCRSVLTTQYGEIWLPPAEKVEWLDPGGEWRNDHARKPDGDCSGIRFTFPGIKFIRQTDVLSVAFVDHQGIQIGRSNNTMLGIPAGSMFNIFPWDLTFTSK